MEARLLKLEEYVHSGEGANGESLNHRTDSSLMVKLYNAGTPREKIENELIFAQKIYDLGIPTPKPGEYVTDGNGRYGIQFQRIVGKKSFSRAIGDNPENVEEYARRFARLCKVLHGTKVSKEEFVSVKDQYRSILSKLDVYTPEERKYIEKVIDEAPDGDTAIHGDLQFSNVITDGKRDVFIDMGDFTYGSPLFDLGMVLFTCLYDNVDFLREVFHMEPESAREFWKYFCKEYFGEDADPDEKEMLLRPYAALKLLIIERDTRVALPEYHWLLKA